ncbi:hypothetical protein L873DRAFT_781243 [Choiromyces venosus 120613-1]|uniref:Uncharacterized protein n=1 Tax=Choiromyces venosus 120613-1 TaxID=1336337 RepID=A0A3N4J4U6_9PEZI|nr:hypothetical protein L873DRAFT_781243 [Choiromyces venosus 120613-1]
MTMTPKMDDPPSDPCSAAINMPLPDSNCEAEWEEGNSDADLLAHSGDINLPLLVRLRHVVVLGLPIPLLKFTILPYRCNLSRSCTRKRDVTGLVCLGHCLICHTKGCKER